MTVFRITNVQWSKSFTASGYPARWNGKGNFVIYTAESRSLACLENLVHRSGEGNNDLYKVILIDVPAGLAVEEIDSSSLMKDWNTIDNYKGCQTLGNNWINELRSPVLKVPSVIIRKEHNYLINPNHRDFYKIKITGVEDFEFDQRF
ncbi:MAG: RES family NAD+ phosphorylase [Ferruginibacter sp.]